MSFHVEWDPQKADDNVKDHGVSFEEAAEVLQDPLSYTVEDEDHSQSHEARFKTIGHSMRGRLLVVIHTDDQHRIRIISAWRATHRQREEYEEGG